jgi:hypothetical protein
LKQHDRTRQSVTSAGEIFARGRSARPQAPIIWFGSVGLAAAATLLFFLGPSTPRPTPPAKAETAASVNPPKLVEPPINPTPQQFKTVKRHQPERPADPPVPHELATDFFLLMDAPPPLERGQLWRVVVPADMMRRVGLPVSQERLSYPVLAEVLVGEEGLAHAIRFVSYQP